MNANLFEGFVVNPVGKVNPDFSKVFLKLPRHWYAKLTLFEDQSGCFCLIPASRPPAGDYQQKVTVFGQVVGKLDRLLVTPFFDSAYQPVEAFEGSVYHFERLLSQIGVQPLVVLVSLTLMVVRLVAQVFAFLKKVLPNGVKPYVVEVFTQSAQLSQSQKLGLIEFSYLVLLSQEHNGCFATVVSIQRNGRIHPANPFSSPG